jgi:L-asparaginase
LFQPQKKMNKVPGSTAFFSRPDTGQPPQKTPTLSSTSPDAPPPIGGGGESAKMLTTQGQGQQRALTEQYKRMKIGILNTGGTISCVGSPLSPMSASDFEQACEQLLSQLLAEKHPGLTLEHATHVPFSASTPHTLDSTNLEPKHWCMMARHILENYAHCDGWVILHGTDSLEFTASALPFLLSGFSKEGEATAALSKSVVITGSQKPMFYQDPVDGTLSLNEGSDAVANFCGAITAASSGVPEVGVYFRDQLLRGNRVRKISTSDFKAFTSPNCAPLAEQAQTFELNRTHGVLREQPNCAISLDQASVRAQISAQLDHVEQHVHEHPVVPLHAFPAGSALHAQLIDAFVQTGIKGLVLSSYGAGNFPSGSPDHPPSGAVYQALARANAQGVVVLNSTQTLQGEVNANTYAAGAWLDEVGAISGGGKTSTASLVKLMLMLAMAGHHGWSLDDVKRLTERSLLGEGGVEPHSPSSSST